MTLVKGSASVLVNVYGPKVGKFAPVVEQVAGQLNLSAAGNIYQGGRPGHEIYLQAFEPSVAHDSRVIQLAINGRGAVEQAWQEIETQLGFLFTLVQNNDAWGISIMYQAEWNSPTQEAVDFSPNFSTINLPGWPACNPLAEINTDIGAVGLIALPTAETTTVPVSTYVILVPKEPQNEFFSTNFLGPSAQFILPDLICHKGYHQHLEWHNETFLTLYRKRLEEMMNAAHETVLAPSDGQNLARSLESLANAYEEMSITLAHLQRLSVSLDRQIHNLSWWLEKPNSAAIFKFHHEQLKNYLFELDLAVREGKTVWESSQRAVSIIDTRLQAEQEQRQERFTILLAILGVVLSAPQLIDREAAAALLQLAGIIPAAESANLLVLLGTQAIIMTGIGLALAVIIRLVLRRKKNHARKQKPVG